jgi:hypothetical protein
MTDADEWQNDVFTLIGHASILREQGQIDMPAYLFRLAEKIAREHVDEAHAQKARELGMRVTTATGG